MELGAPQPRPELAAAAAACLQECMVKTRQQMSAWYESILGRSAETMVDAEGRPDVRIVLLKGVDETGFTFFTNLESVKGVQLAGHPVAALCFHWKSQRRQVRVRGGVTPVSAAEADAYFASRAAQSRISAIASDQSRPLADRAVFEQRVAEISSIYGDDNDIPRPPHWGGFRLAPTEIEFWQDQAFRMHDRLRFYRKEEGGWATVRLYP